ncbi:PWWP domain-containing DNA repair factor 3A isoform X2 [Pantherophis guttatus]|uniref:PWWP domain-containing DNA repair factor 3A isoform X2 n=1 Tax=Pantherophis guttatus TaxID=94885 RepID=A0A6P9CFF6_PANGU|nr:PWWP domain-containing DNA repair factor 3A isoform X2 [Pantherophis guttatus]
MMMSEGEYVFCKWKKRLWPAQILCRSQSSRGRLLPEKLGSIRLKIIAENKQVTMRVAHIVPLTVQSIEDIAEKLAPSNEAQKVVEELTYRRALRELLEIMKKRAAPKSPDPCRRRSEEATTRKGQQGQSSAPPEPLSPRRSPRGTKRMEAGRTLSDSPAKSLRPLESRTNNLPTCKPPSSASGDLPGVRKPAPKPNISRSLAAPPQLTQKSPVASKEHRQVGGPSGRKAPSNRPVRTSTPDSTSHKCRPRFPSAKGRDETASKLRRNLLGPALEGFSSQPAGAPPAKREARKRKKWQQPSKGSRCSPRLEATSSKQILATQEPSLERSQWMSGRQPTEHREPSLDCAPWELKRDPDPYRAAVRGGWLPEFEDNEDQASDLSLQLSPVRKVSPSPESKDEEEEEEEELPSIFLHKEPCCFEAGMMVWCKLPRYPYWPAVVKKVNRKAKKANVVLIEKCMDATKTKGFSTSLRNLKHFDCKEKQTLIEKARENYSHELNWCISLIADYRIRVGCHSFGGSFLEYCADDMNPGFLFPQGSPVRKESFHTLSQMSFPQMEVLDSGELLAEITPPKQVKKILPDRTRAARDRANKRIVEFIVNAKGADEHLRSILKSQKQSRWLRKSLKTPRYLILETYLEDDYQQDLVLNYLKEVYREVGAKTLPVKNRDSAKFVLEVLFPEAIIYAISVVHQIDYKTAEEKYINGPPVSKREREEFEKEIQEEKQNFAKKARSHL